MDQQSILWRLSDRGRLWQTSAFLIQIATQPTRVESVGRFASICKLHRRAGRNQEVRR